MSVNECIEFSPYFYSKVCSLENDLGLMDQALEFRYQVYVEECSYLPATDYPDKRESDENDCRSSHFCAFNLSNELVGYSRLVRADDELRFPFERHCNVFSAGANFPPPEKTVEISRMIVHRSYRRRRGDHLNGVTLSGSEGDGKVDRRTNSPQILLSLYRQMYVYSKSNGFLFWYAAMEPQVARALSGIGVFKFRQIGPVGDYYGDVAPYIASLDEIEESVRARNPAMLAWLERLDSGN